MNGKETGMMRRRQVGVTKAPRWVLLWILLGIKMHMVEAAEEEISTRQETECMLETAPVPRAGNEIRWKRMNTCDRGWREGEHWQKGKSEHSQGKDPKIFEGNSQEKDPSTSEGRSHQVERWRVQEKWKEEKWKKKKQKTKKKVKHRKVKWWKKCKELIISLSMIRIQRGKKRKEGKTVRDAPK